MSGGRPASRRDQVIEDYEWLAGTDHPDNIARRLGYRNGDSLTKQLWNWGQRDLAARLTSGYRTDSRRAVRAPIPARSCSPSRTWRKGSPGMSAKSRGRGSRPTPTVTRARCPAGKTRAPHGNPATRSARPR